MTTLRPKELIPDLCKGCAIISHKKINCDCIPMKEELQ